MMDALEFLKEHRRMCDSHLNCDGCPLMNAPCLSSDWSEISDKALRDIVLAVTLWSKDNPPVTNEMKFREVFGDNAVNSVLAVHMSDIKRWLAEPYKERE